jgi:hypothetical protein
MLVSAIESLCDQREVSDSYRSLIDHVRKFLSQLEECKAEDKKTALNLLNNQKGQSVTHAIRSKIAALLGPEKASKFLDQKPGEAPPLYSLRGNYVHDGKGRGEVGKRAEEVFQLAAELLVADIRHTVSGETPIASQ